MFNTKLDKAVQKVAAKKKAGEEILKEDITPVNAELEAQGLEGYAVAKVEDVNALESSVETLTAEKKELQEKLTASEAEVKRLGELPGAEHTTVKKKKDTAQEEQKVDPYRSEADEELDALLEEQKID